MSLSLIHAKSRTISILLAIGGGIGLIWLLLVRAKWNPPAGEAEFFWFRVFIVFSLNTAVQQWTLATEDDEGTAFYASLDMVASLIPVIVFIMIEVYWLGAESMSVLSWRHHVVGSMWAIYSIIDFFSTYSTNRRLAELAAAIKK